MMSRFHGLFLTCKMKPPSGQPPNEGVMPMKAANIMTSEGVVNRKVRKTVRLLIVLIIDDNGTIFIPFDSGDARRLFFERCHQ